MSGPVVTFYRNWSAFVHTRDQDDVIMVGVDPNGEDQGGNYEFAIEGVGSAPRSGNYIGARVGLFDDSWRALTDLPELWLALADLDTSTSNTRVGVSLDQVAEVLSSLGYRDRTSEFADRHTHVFRCQCGEYPGAHS